MGPNEGKNLLEMALCFARAIIAHDAVSFENLILYSKAHYEYIKNYGYQEGKFEKIISSSGTHFIHLGSSMEDGSRSCETLPKGAKIQVTFDLTPGKGKFLKEFERIVSFLESAKPDSVFAVLNIEPRDIAAETKHTMRAMFVDTIARLRKTVLSYQSGYNEKKIENFRMSLKKSNRYAPVTYKSDTLFIVSPQTLSSFVNSLAVERLGYYADAYLYGCVNAVAGICNYCATQAEKKKITPTNNFAINFVGLAEVLTCGKQSKPAEILKETVLNALSWGFLEELTDFVNNYRRYIEGRIEEALDSETCDECCEILYDVIPYSLSAKIILETLLTFPDQLGEKLRFIKSSYCMLDEINNRLKVAVQNQVLDFDSSCWRISKTIIADKKHNNGIAAAKKWVDSFIERDMYYPRALKSKLLA